jgi:hypothetical protein
MTAAYAHLLEVLHKVELYLHQRSDVQAVTLLRELQEAIAKVGTQQ